MPNKEELKSYIEEGWMTKNQFLDFLSIVLNAPKEMLKIPLQGTDLRDYKILSGAIRTTDELAAYEYEQSS